MAQLASSCVRSIGNLGNGDQQQFEVHPGNLVNDKFPMPSAHSLKQAVPPNTTKFCEAAPKTVLREFVKGSKHSNLKELRADNRGQVLRIAFAFDPDRAAILLVGGDKSGRSQKQFYKQLLSKAEQLYDAHLAKIQAQKKKKGP